MITEKDLQKLNFEKIQDSNDDGIMPCTVYQYQYVDPGDDNEDPYVFLTMVMITNPGFNKGEWVIEINPCEHTEESNMFINDLTTLHLMMGCFQKLYFYRLEGGKINLN